MPGAALETHQPDVGHGRRRDELGADEVAADPVAEQPLAGAEHGRDDGDVQLVEQPGPQVLPDGRRAPPSRTALPPAAANACSRADSMPSVTKTKVVPPANSIGSCAWWVSTNTG